MSAIKRLGPADEEKNDQQESVSSGQSYVRVTKIDNRGYVEFQFSIGDPNLYLEMALPRAAFDEFCATQQAQHLTREQEDLVDRTERKWRYGDVNEEEPMLNSGS